MTTLNCAHNTEYSTEHTSPSHDRKHRFSIKKSGAISKVVRAKLTKSFHNIENVHGNDHNNQKKENALGETKNNNGSHNNTIPTSSTVEQQQSGNIVERNERTEKNTKKRSKLCYLL